MRYASLREAVCTVNCQIAPAGLALLTWGNVSGVDRAAGVMAIKPSGVAYAKLRPADIVVLDIASGAVVEGSLRPSSDTPTHLHLYRHFSCAGGLVHTHSRCATAWAQAARPLPCFGTTHADYFNGSVPVTRHLTADEVAGDYELNTGCVIVERFDQGDVCPSETPAVLVAGHGPFVWGPTAAKALENAIVLEEVAHMGLHTLALRGRQGAIPDYLLERHFSRKHGKNAYYGQA